MRVVLFRPRGRASARLPSRKSLNLSASMKVTITDQNGEQLASAPGSAVLGHPLNAVLWLRDSGITFKEGDMISVGSIGPLLPPKSGPG